MAIGGDDVRGKGRDRGVKGNCSAPVNTWLLLYCWTHVAHFSIAVKKGGEAGRWDSYQG